MKKLLVLFLFSVLYLWGTPDISLSYFTVSTHQPKANEAVTVSAHLLDERGQACEAQHVIIQTDAGEVTVTPCIAKGKGLYLGTVVLPAIGMKATLKVLADGAEIKENIMPDGGALECMGHYHQDRQVCSLERTNEGLRMVKLSELDGSAFCLGAIQGSKLIHDRKYAASIHAKYRGVTGKGVCLNSSQYDIKGKACMSDAYSRWYNGDGECDIAMDLVPVKNSDKLSVYTFIFAGSGIAEFTKPRIEVLPTLISQAARGECSRADNSATPFNNADDYLPAAIDGLEEIWNLPENQELHPAAGRKLNGVEAWNLRQQLLERKKRHEADETAEMMNDLRAGNDEEIDVQVSDEPEYGKQIRAMYFARKTGDIIIDGNMQEWKDYLAFSNFSALQPTRKQPADYATKVSACYDDENLYLAVHCEGKPEVVGKPAPKDGADMWRCDVVEFFFGNESDMGYRQFAVAAAGQLYDGDTSDGMVNFQWQGTASVEEDGWNVEVSIPWKSLGYESAAEEMKFNVCRTFQGKEVSCWSLHANGFAERRSMGFLIRDSFQGCADEADYMALRNRKAFEKRYAEAEQAARARASMKNGKKLMLTAWDDERDFEKNKDFQVRFLVERLKNKTPQILEFKQAINEFAHANFIVSTQAEAPEITFNVSALRNESGVAFPSDGVKLYRILYLEPDEGLWPDFYKTWSGRPLPELVEEFEGTLSLKEFESSQFRLYLDSRKALPGIYKGKLEVMSGNQSRTSIDISCEVLPFAITPCQDLPFEIAIFSQIPYGGKSGEAWAKLFQEHYISIVDFEHYRVFVDGELSQSPGWRAENYIRDLCAYKLPEGANVTFDTKLYDIDDRLAICARYGLMPIMTNRTGSIWPELMPALSEHLQSLGIPPNKWIYKLGDEDHSPWFVPLARKIREYLPETPLACIPAGNEYWDLRELAKGFNRIIFSRSAMTINEEGEKHLREMQAQGVVLSRYTNDTSWTERTPRLAGRRDLWEVMIRDRMDGFQIWTAGLYPQLDFGLGYSSAYKVPVHNYPPEHQTTCQLVYVRKQGDFYKPISCIRLEDMRDGVVDTLYYREAQRRLEAAGDADGLKKLNSTIKMAKGSPADFKKAREIMIQLIMAH